VLEDLDGRIDAVFCADSPALGIESTVVDCTAPAPIVLRPGGITLEQIRQVVPTAQDYNAQTHSAEHHRDSPPVPSPGLLHPHYQPQAQVRLVQLPLASGSLDDSKTAFCGLQRPSDSDRLAPCTVYATVEAYAAGFYEFLREADRQAVETILVQRAPDQGIGKALQDRQRRAAGG
jgi:L-threonylcarbamoyladenylate synthase